MGEAAKLTRWGDRAVVSAWLAAALLTVVAAIVIAYVGSPGAPYWDHWGYLDPADYLQHMFARHNGHPMLVGRLLLAFDYYVADAQGWLLIVLTLAALGLAVWSFVVLARLAGLSGASLAIAGALPAVFLFNPQGWEYLRWPFETFFVLEFVAAIGAAAALAAYAVTRKAWKLALSVLASLTALGCLNNGLLLPFLLAAMAAYLRLPLRVVLLQLAAILFAIPLYSGGEPGAPLPASFAIAEIIPYALRLLGGGPAWAAGFAFKLTDIMPIATAIGVLLVAAAVFALARFVLVNRRSPSGTALVLLIVFAGLSAAGAAAGRFLMGPESALSSRYCIVGAVFASALLLLIVTEFDWSKLPAWVTRGALAVGALLALIVPVSVGSLGPNLAGRERYEVGAQTALVVGVRDTESAGALVFNMDVGLEQSAKLREARKWHFSDRWSRAIGTQQDFSGATACSGGAFEIDAAGAAQGYARLTGWIDRTGAGRGRIVVIARGSEIVGYGVVHKHVSDLSLGLLLNPAQRGWRGHARIDAATAFTPLTAYLASRDTIVCRIGSTVAPSAP